MTVKSLQTTGKKQVGKYPKGHSGNPTGRPRGSQNKITMAAKEAFQRAFDDVGGTERLATWATDNLTEFYKLYARLIPAEVSGKLDVDQRTQHIISDRPMTPEEWAAENVPGPGSE